MKQYLAHLREWNGLFSDFKSRVTKLLELEDMTHRLLSFHFVLGGLRSNICLHLILTSLHRDNFTDWFGLMLSGEDSNVKKLIDTGKIVMTRRFHSLIHGDNDWNGHDLIACNTCGTCLPSEGSKIFMHSLVGKYFYYTFIIYLYRINFMF